ncbi:DUF1758 domain-containing protein [Trichonephila clavipes]|nr:DUF1758 domain-containing protein [Trichonephila clavipes]
MNLNALKAQRKGLRTAFSNCLKKIESELAHELCNIQTLSVLKIQFNDKFPRMDSCQNAISETLLLPDDGERLFAEDLEDAEIFREKFWELTTKIELKSQECTVPSDKESRKFKLPKIELKKFNGEAKEYLTFWSQFQKIHEDREIAAEDKMQYLLQSVEPGSKAERLVLSFPATAANYPVSHTPHLTATECARLSTPHLTVTECARFSRFPTPTETFWNPVRGHSVN